MIGIIFATKWEAKPFLELVTARELAERPFHVYQFSFGSNGTKGVAIISGMGKVSAALATQQMVLVHHVTEIINAGICGAAADGIQVGKVFRIIQSRAGDVEGADEERNVYEASQDRWKDLPSARLTTVDRPIFSPEYRKQIALWSELVDMEGAAVAKACSVLDVKVHLIKVVTDLADEDAQEAIKKNIKVASERLAEVLCQGLSGAPSASEGKVLQLLRFTRVEHTVFSLPLLFAGAWLGAGRGFPSLKVILLILLAGVGARTLGMAMNRILDRNLDAQNPRTANRELPAGRISVAGAYSVALVGLGAYLLACVLIGRTCTILSPIPALLLITYSLLKRFTSFCHFGIGLCLAMAPLGAFVAASDGPEFNLYLNIEITLLAIFTFCWISAFDIIYALQDVESDRLMGVKSLPAKLGPFRAQIAAAVVHLIGLVAIALLIPISNAGPMACAALFVVLAAIGLAYVPWIPLPVRFFPLSAIAGIAGALIPFLGGRT